MQNILVTGSQGFVGRNLVTALRRRTDERAVNVLTFGSTDNDATLARLLDKADIVFHLAGANRPPSVEDFHTINTALTGRIVQILERTETPAAVIFASSTQAELDNPYGRSKRAAEELLVDYHRRTGNPTSIYRLPNVFGKWSRPNYNTVVATFCHNISRGMEISIDDPSRELTLVYIDEVVRRFLRHLDKSQALGLYESVNETFKTTVGQLARKLQDIHAIRKTLTIPDLSDPFTKYLYATYLSFLAPNDLAYDVGMKFDERGWLFELIKSDKFGQIFVSTTKPGITRGNHYHDSKIEKFCLIQGSGTIRFRQIDSPEVLEYLVDDKQVRVVDIPPGYTHSIENTGSEDMIVLFWANELFDPNQPDTYWIPVIE